VATVVRPLRCEDRPLLLSWAAGLSAATIASRFGLPRRPEAVREDLEWIGRLDGLDQAALGAFAVPATGAAPSLVAVARFVRVPARPATTEIAVTVSAAWPGRGVGHLPAGRLADGARAAGYAALLAVLVGDGSAPLRLALGLGPCRRLDEESLLVDLRPRQPGPGGRATAAEGPGRGRLGA